MVHPPYKKPMRAAEMAYRQSLRVRYLPKHSNVLYFRVRMSMTTHHTRQSSAVRLTGAKFEQSTVTPPLSVGLIYPLPNSNNVAFGAPKIPAHSCNTSGHVDAGTIYNRLIPTGTYPLFQRFVIMACCFHAFLPPFNLHAITTFVRFCLLPTLKPTPGVQVAIIATVPVWQGLTNIFCVFARGVYQICFSQSFGVPKICHNQHPLFIRLYNFSISRKSHVV